MAKIVICGETYSQNLGDGVIADSLTWLLKQAYVSVDVSIIDLSGREGFNADNAIKEVKLSGLRTIHQSLSRISFYRKVTIPILWFSCSRTRFHQLWRKILVDSDLILIGGGQLLMGNHLGFILKIREIIIIANKFNKKVAFYSCGVGNKWQWIGLRLLNRVLTAECVRWISVRDGGSLDILNDHIKVKKIKFNLSIDPAVCVAEAYGIKAKLGSKIIGLGLSAPRELSWAVSSKGVFMDRHVRDFWLGLIELLSYDHRKIVIFTNGQLDDYYFAQNIFAEITKKINNKQVSLMERARNPRELTEQIAQFQGIVAHRLHANIIAYSLGIPTIGLIWDKKVAEFGKITGRSDFFLDPINMVPQVVKECLYSAINAGVDTIRLAEHKVSVIKSVQSMLLSTCFDNLVNSHFLTE